MRVATTKMIAASFLVVALFTSGSLAVPYASNNHQAAAPQTSSIMPSRFTGTPEFKYFAERDETLVQVFIPLLEKSFGQYQSERLGMYARFVVPGKKVTEPKHVTIELRSESPKPQYKEDDARRFAMMLNGQKFISGTMALISTQPNPVGAYSESMMRSVAYGTFLQISMAREIRILLGNDKFDLTRDQLNALIRLAKTIEP